VIEKPAFIVQIRKHLLTPDYNCRCSESRVSNHKFF